MKIAFVSLYQAYPATSGAAYVTYNCARLTPCTALLVQVAAHSTVEQIANLTIVSLQLSTSSRLKKLAFMPSTIRQMTKEVAGFKPDHVVIEGASWAVYLVLLVSALRKAVPKAKIVYHAHNVEYLLRQERNGRLVAAVTWIAEKHILITCDRCYAVSQEDRMRFSSLYGVLPSLLPNGVDCDANQATSAEIEAVRARYVITDEAVLFMGLYGYPPNTEAVRFLIEEVMPDLVRQLPNLRIVVTGGGPPSSPSWVISTGVISRTDLAAVLGACRIGVAPIFKGSGTRLKILEYMAAGLPVISTRKGAEGLNLKANQHVLYAETAEEFQNAILRLLRDPSESNAMSLYATALVRSNFDWVPLLRRFARELDGLKDI